jgi:hypothetical protein
LAPLYIRVADRTCHCRYAHSYTLSLVRYTYCPAGNVATSKIPFTRSLLALIPTLGQLP